MQLSPDGSGIHGQIYRAVQGDSGKRLTRYAVTLRPQLSYLAHRINQRIFQNLTVAKIVGMVLEEHGIQSNAYEFKVGAIYPERIYCVQYDESDLQFIQRLETRTSRTTRSDYDFEKPRLTLESANRGDALPDLEDYDYPGRFIDRERGKHLAKRALERQRSDFQLAEGKSDQPLLVSGHFLALTQHPKAKWNDPPVPDPEQTAHPRQPKRCGHRAKGEEIG